VAGSMSVTALGTAFSVRNDNEGTPTVTVTEHKVLVENTSSPLTESAITLEAGQQVTLLESDERLTAIKEINSEQEIAWQSGRYVFIDRPLNEVIEELNRYYQGKIIIRDETLGTLKVSGVLNLDDPIESLRGLTDTLPIKMTNFTPYIIFIERD
jgi:transmembrane sensor